MIAGGWGRHPKLRSDLCPRRARPEHLDYRSGEEILGAAATGDGIGTVSAHRKDRTGPLEERGVAFSSM